jgi:hypothetical protein
MILFYTGRFFTSGIRENSRNTAVSPLLGHRTFGFEICGRKPTSAKASAMSAKGYSSKTVSGIQFASEFELKIELKNVILVAFRFFALLHSQGQNGPDGPEAPLPGNPRKGTLVALEKPLVRVPASLAHACPLVYLFKSRVGAASCPRRLIHD